HLNLPVNITFYNPHGKQTKIEYIYDAVGSKKAKKVHYYEPDYSGGGGSEMKRTIVSTNTTQTNSSVGPTTYVQKIMRTDYLDGGFQYKDEVLQFFSHFEGFVMSDKGNYVYYFNYTDHLGNVRVKYTDDGSGTPYIVEESNYYPFGLKHKGYNEPEQNMKDWGYILTMESSLNHKYKFQGQERQDELGLNWDSFKWRNYDYAIGRFMSVDPLTEKYNTWSPYTFSGNIVIHARELEGLEPHLPFDDMEKAAENFGSQYNGYSIANKREVGTQYYKIKVGDVYKYSYTTPVEGDPVDLNGNAKVNILSSNDLPEGGQYVGDGHGHGNDSNQRFAILTRKEYSLKDFDEKATNSELKYLQTGKLSVLKNFKIVEGANGPSVGSGDMPFWQNQIKRLGKNYEGSYTFTPSGLVWITKNNEGKPQFKVDYNLSRITPSDPNSIMRMNNVSGTVTPVVKPLPDYKKVDPKKD
ncbi:DUF4329 domain-containing protein, partial [Flavobacterium amniphilum]|uniref:RHS repeat domain-containing protein n=1 Tax=Flavobacterium amniphilum TaxID=1834035 RepID=UPI002029B6F9